jgi:cytoskeletal protein RodZ
MERELRIWPSPMAVAELLRAARERRGLTLEHLARETKIAVDRLTAFEREGVPPTGGFYHRAQIRAYAQALRLDESHVLDALNQELAAAAPVPLPPTPQARAPRIPVSSSAVALGCVIAVALLSGTLLTRQIQAARAAESASFAPASDRTTQPVRLEQHNQTASSDVARASLPASTPVKPAPAPAAVQAVSAAPAIVAAPSVPGATGTQLVIVTKPEGARVTVDGIGWGVTPVTIRHLSEGLRRVRVTADGHAAVEREIDVQPDRVNKVSILLRSLPHPQAP